jgi:hypothetical protein
MGRETKKTRREHAARRIVCAIPAASAKAIASRTGSLSPRRSEIPAEVKGGIEKAYDRDR